MTNTYNIFLIDLDANNHFITNIPKTFQPEEFLIDHGFDWMFYYCTEDELKQTSYKYDDDKLIRVC